MTETRRGETTPEKPLDLRGLDRRLRKDEERRERRTRIESGERRKGSVCPSVSEFFPRIVSTLRGPL